jgi:hypothetical protein
MIPDKYKVPDLESYYPGLGCKCEARDQSECGGCDADWTSRREYELMAEVNKLRAILESEGYNY